jgi:sn-glycerol 3-phosphate transport system substrate-binding protein
MKRSLTAVACALAILAGACGGSSDNADNGGGGGGSSSSACPVDAFKKATSPVKVVVWSSYVGKTEQTLEKLADEYNASQSKVKVEVQVVANSYAELFRKFQAAIPTNDLPAITVGEDIDTRYMADSGKVLPAQDCIDVDKDPRASNKDILPPIRAAYTVDGKQYPASMNVSTIVLYYNRDHFRKAGLDPDKPPTTLAEVMADAQKIKDAGVSKEPFVMKQDPWFVEQWITGAHQTMVNHDNGRDGKLATKATLDNKTVHDIFDWLAEMKRKDLINAVPGTDGQVNHFFAMATQSSSMLIETSAAITTIDGVLQGTFDPADLGLGHQYDNLKNTKISIDVGVGQNPGLTEPGKGQVGGGASYITNTTSKEVQSAAWDFMKFFNEPKNQATWTQEGSYLPIVASVKDQPSIAQDWKTTNRGKWLATAWNGISSLDAKFPGALIGPYDKFRDTLRKSIEGVTLSGGDPDQAVKDAQAGVTAELKDYAENNF